MAVNSELVFEFSPTGYEIARAKAAKLTPKQEARAKQGQLKILMSRYVISYDKGTSGEQYVKLCQIADYCAAEQIETPIYVRWMMLMHKAAQGNPMNDGSARESHE